MKVWVLKHTFFRWQSEVVRLKICSVTFQNVSKPWMDGWKWNWWVLRQAQSSQGLFDSSSTQGCLTAFTFSVKGHSYNTVKESCMKGSRKETMLQPGPKTAAGPFLSILHLKIPGAWKTFSKVCLQSSILSESQAESSMCPQFLKRFKTFWRTTR